MKKEAIKNNILAISSLLKDEDPKHIQRKVADRTKQARLNLNLTQKALATLADVSFSSYRRFENTGEIAFASLVKIAIVLDVADDFGRLFIRQQIHSIEELTQLPKKTKKRGRNKN